MTQILSGAGGFALGMAYAAFVMSRGREITPGDESTMRLVGMILGIVILLLYFVVMEGAFGLTIGKLLTGTRVVNAAGGKASFGQIIGRSCARMIPFEPFSFVFGDTTSGWHDSLSGTRVIDIRAARRQES